MSSNTSKHGTRIARVLFVWIVALGAAGPLAAQTVAITAHDGWAREPVPSRDVTALFVVLENRGATARAVVSGESDAAAKVELHEMKMDGAMMRMSPVNQIDVPAGGKTELKPGGLHVMMFGLKKRPAPGDTLTVTLTLDDGTKVPVTATVRREEVKP
jgi:periplasmic copper chaperone A